MGGWVLDFMRLILISTQVEVVVEVRVELGKIRSHEFFKKDVYFSTLRKMQYTFFFIRKCKFGLSLRVS